MAPKTSARREVVRSAAKFIGAETTDDIVAAGRGARSPLARVRKGLSWFTAAPSAAELPENVLIGLRAILVDLFDWKTAPGAPSMVNKATVKTVAAGLESHYGQMVEMLSFASAWSPVLGSADRLLNLIREAGSVSTAYAPERYVVKFSGNLQRLLTGDDVSIQPARLEELAISMWRSVHDGRYWDVAGAKPNEETVRARRAAGDAEATAHAEHMANLLAGAHPNSPEAFDALVMALASSQLPLTEHTSEMVTALPYTVKYADVLSEIAEVSRRGDWVNPDVLVLTSLVPWLAPGDRPESPASWLAARAIASWTDPDTGQLDRQAWPEKPKTWADVYPEEPIAGKFAFPNAIHRLHQSTLPGLDVPMTLIRTAAELTANREYMGNCTGAYLSEMERGSYALFRFTVGDVDFNAAAVLGRNGHWGLREINSRFNEGNVPPAVRTAFEEVVAAMPPVK